VIAWYRMESFKRSARIAAHKNEVEKDGITLMNSPDLPNEPAASPMTESAFNDRVDDVLVRVESAFDNIDEDIDSELNGGILTLTFANGSKVIVNRQAPLREIWLAAKSGGFHFRFDGMVWRDTRSGETLQAALTRVVNEQSGANNQNVISITF
jgi:CyaY protein